jgi:hypothetical protein
MIWGYWIITPLIKLAYRRLNILVNLIGYTGRCCRVNP